MFVLEFDEEDEDDDEFFRKWSKDHTTLLKGSDVFSPKKHIFIEYVWTQYFWVYFSQQKKMIVKDEDYFDGAFPFGSLFEQLFPLINFFLFLVNWYISRTAGSNLNSKKAPIRSMTFYSISKRVKILRRLIEIFFNKVLS